MEIEILFKKLYVENIRYLICGGLAVNLYGVNRMTADIDILLDLTVENIDKFHSAIRSLDFFPVLPLPMKLLANNLKRLELIEQKNLIAFSFYNAEKKFMNIDVIIDIPNSFDELWNRKEIRTNLDFKLNIISLEDLIALKEFVSREQDKNDVLLLRKIQNERKKIR